MEGGCRCLGCDMMDSGNVCFRSGQEVLDIVRIKSLQVMGFGVNWA